MNDYQREQLEALALVKDQLKSLAGGGKGDLRETIAPYLGFRREVDRFLENHFQTICTLACYQDRRSACCSKDGIITFFADHVVNALVGGLDRLAIIDAALRRDNTTTRCIYLTPRGCCWSVRPLVCAMFLCDRAQEAVLTTDAAAAARWEQHQQAAKGFRWPDRPVLFDHLERVFIDAGHRSALMYLNFSPGLRRIKQKAGLPLSPVSSLS